MKPAKPAIALAFTALLALAFVATSHAAPRVAPKAGVAPGCSVESGYVWAVRPNPERAPQRGVADRNFALQAFSNGPTCAKAVVVFVIRDPSGKIVHAAAHQSEYVLPTKDARTRVQMQAALADWVGAATMADNHDNLPNWPAGMATPAPHEFPFTPDPDISRADYLAIKANKTPYFCYVQGMESMRCLVLKDGALEPFGVQSFPG